MTEPTNPDEPFDPTADTGRFQAFVRGGEPEDGPAPAGASFRVITLVVGLLVLAALVAVLFLF